MEQAKKFYQEIIQETIQAQTKLDEAIILIKTRISHEPVKE